MVRKWMGVALVAGWMGISASAQAQSPPSPAGAAPPPGPAAGAPLPPGPPTPGAGMAPGAPGGAGSHAGPAAPYPVGPVAPNCLPIPYNPHSYTECLPPNSFSPPPDPGPRPHHIYISGEYLWWWVKKRQVPPLVSRGDLADPFPGAAGMPGSRPFLGPGSADDSDAAGGRVTVIWWFNDCQTCGLDGSFFGMEQDTQFLSAGSPGFEGDLLLARPFSNPNTGLPDASPLAIPGVMGGALAVVMPRQFYGGDLNLRFAQEVSGLSPHRLSFLVGTRYLSLTEKLNISEGISEHTGEGVEGNVFAIQDFFTTYNRFYGGQVGAESEVRFGSVVLTTALKLALGKTQQTVKIAGDSVAFEPPTQTLTIDPTRGFLAQPTNIGRYRKSDLGFIPEVTVTVAWDFNTYIRAWVGYNFLWWSDIVRPGDQIDPWINLQPIGSPPFLGVPFRPTVPFTSTDFWAQGLTFGLQVSY